MKKSLIPFIAFLFVALFAVAASAQGYPPPPPEKPKSVEPKKEEASPLLIKWDVVFSAPGQDYVGTLKLEKDKDNYKGVVTTELGEAPLSSIKVTGDSFSAGIVVNAQGQSLDGTISGKVTNGQISGDLNLAAVGAIPFTGKKSK